MGNAGRLRYEEHGEAIDAADLVFRDYAQAAYRMRGIDKGQMKRHNHITRHGRQPVFWNKRHGIRRKRRYVGADKGKVGKL